MATAAPMPRGDEMRHAIAERASLWFAVAATGVVILLPTAAISVGVRLTGTNPHPVLVWISAAVLSASLLFAGTHWWMRQPGSTLLSFGELMLWRWFKRMKADNAIRSGAQTLEHDVATTRQEQVRLLRELNTALEIRDPYTRGHARRVERHAYRTALAMHMHLEDIFNLRLAASLHDIGKIEVPIEVIRKQRPLDDDEWALMKRHPATGAEMISAIGNEELVSAVRHHHERFEGGGYPDGVAGLDIPLHARIIAVCDTFDAITSTRSYRSKSSRDKALSIIREQSGKQFDPRVVDAFLKALPRSLPGVAALSWLSFPAVKRVLSQFTTVSRDAGVAGVAGALAASGMVGAVTASAVSPGKYLNRPAIERAQQERHADHAEDGAVVLETAAEPQATGSDQVRHRRVDRRSHAANKRAKAASRRDHRAREERSQAPGQERSAAAHAAKEEKVETKTKTRHEKKDTPAQSHVARAVPAGQEKKEAKEKEKATEAVEDVVDDAIETVDEADVVEEAVTHGNGNGADNANGKGKPK